VRTSSDARKPIERTTVPARCCAVLGFFFVTGLVPGVIGSGLAVILVPAVIVGVVLVEIGMRRIYERLTGQPLGKWPTSFPSVSTQMRLASPSALMTIATQADLPPRATVVVLYGLLIVGVLVLAVRTF
jgi:hypothetical protein